MNGARNLEKSHRDHPVFQVKSKLKTWYLNEKRDLPWRTNPSVYGTWLSEIMLQQTRMETGVPRWHAFLEDFPTVEDLARAEEQTVMKAWEGLGYYRRARLLHAAAQEIAKLGDFPATRHGWLELPGIGEYTSAAIASIALGEPVAAVDGNVQRVVSRLFAVDLPVDSGAGKRLIQHLAEELLDRDDPGTHNQAVMELGALVCKPRNPDCPNCPLASACASSHSAEAWAKFPVKKPKKAATSWKLQQVITHHDDRLIVVQRPSEGIWAGLWVFPESGPEGCSSVPLFEQPVKHVLTHRHIEAHFSLVEVASREHLGQEAERQGGQVVTWDELEALPMPRLITKLRDSIKNALQPTQRL